MKKVKNLTFLGYLLTKQNSIREEIIVTLKAGNPCYYTVQTLLSSRLPSKNLTIKIYKTITLSFVLYGCKTWSLTLREECRLRVFENRILKSRGMRMGSGKGSIMTNLIVCTVNLI
jgi:hypothetical protein